MDNVFIGYNTTILPNVTIGNNVIIGACSIVTKDLKPNGVYVGFPARRIGSFDAYVEKCRQPKAGSYRYATVSQCEQITHDEIEQAWALFYQNRKG